MQGLLNALNPEAHFSFASIKSPDLSKFLDDSLKRKIGSFEYQFDQPIIYDFIFIYINVDLYLLKLIL